MNDARNLLFFTALSNKAELQWADTALKSRSQKQGSVLHAED